MKKQDAFKGKVEVEIGGIKYCGTVIFGKAEAVVKKTTYPIWGVRIDRKNSDPESSVEYIGEAEGYAPARATEPGSWTDNPIFNKIKPCLVMSGEVIDYLNPNNYAEAEDGHPLSNIRNHSDTMVEFGKIYYRISQDDRYNYIEITDNAAALADGFTDWAFSYKGKVQDKFYIGAYLGNVKNGKLRSISGVMPTGNKAIGQFRTAAQANGKGYEILAFNKLVLLQILYVIRFKSLDSRAALGKGLTQASEYAQTGKTDQQGLYYGDQDGKSRVKCHGLEDFWGNLLQWIDGLVTTDKISVADGNFNDTGAGYEKAADLPKTVRGIITDIHGSNKLGFVPKEADSDLESGKSHYCNRGSTWTDNAGALPIFGGSRDEGADAGAFFFFVYYSAAPAKWCIGARLLYCGGKE